MALCPPSKHYLKWHSRLRAHAQHSRMHRSWRLSSVDVPPADDVEPLSDAASSGGGLGGLLPAIAVTGIVGYVIQITVPLWADDAQSYVTFSVFWAALYIAVAALSGVQQEIARASRPARAGKGYAVLARYVGAVSLFTFVVSLAASAFFGAGLFRENAVVLAALFVFGAVSYVSLAAIGGVLFGAQRTWPVMLFLVLDTGLRLVLMLLVMALSDSPVIMAVAVVVPFALSALMLLAVARRTTPVLTLDSDLPQLLRNSFQTVLASAAMGCIISGLPLFLALAGVSATVGAAASTILLTTLVRAPLVIPLMALQSFFVVKFRDTTRVGRSVIAYGGALTAIALAAAAVAAWIGPGLFSLVFGSYEPVSSALVFGLVLSAGFMGLLFITGAAVLASEGHFYYVIGWLAAAASVIAVLLVPAALTFETTVVLALFVGPLVGGGVHVMGLTRLAKRG